MENIIKFENYNMFIQVKKNIHFSDSCGIQCKNAFLVTFG